MIDPRTPILVGVGQVDHGGDDAPEPVELLARAADAAVVDTGSQRIRAALQSVQVVRIVSWRYRNPAALVAQRIGSTPRHTVATTHGGQTPQALVNRAAEAILAGQLDVVLIGGAESFRTRRAYAARGQRPPWSTEPEGTAPSETVGTELTMVNETEQGLGLRDPIQAYPLFEDALRVRHGRTPAEQRDLAARLWSRFSAVAATNPHAAIRRSFTAEEIATPSATNRMIGFPYTKLLNSNSNVNQAAAVVMCSVRAAQDLGIASDRWVFLHGGAEANEIPFLSNRADLGESVAIRVAGRALFRALGIDGEDIAHLDLYSCFPSAVEVGAEALGIPIDRQLTVTGGLTFAGGPWNNYVSHSLATMVDTLRHDPGVLGMCTANGGLLSKHALGVYSTTPPSRPVRVLRPQAEVDRSPRRALAEGYTGPATIEARTVMFGRDGSPERAFAACLVNGSARAWAASSAPDVLEAVLAEDRPTSEIVIGKGAELRLSSAT